MADIIVVGGGASGLLTATLLAQSGADVVLVERHALPPESPGEAPELRVVALSPASEQILRACGVWSHLDHSRMQLWSRMRVWESAETAGVEFRTSDIDEARLGYIVENSNLVQALYQMAYMAGVTFYNPDEVTQIVTGTRKLELVLHEGPRQRAEIVIAADGAFSSMRHMHGFWWDYKAHQQQAIVAEIVTENDQPEVAWQRFTPHGTVALLPLFNGNYSLVWSTVDAEQLMNCEQTVFEENLNRIMSGRLGRLHLQGPKACLDLGRGFAPRWCDGNLALLGDAAHVVHPLAGLGQNIGFMDAAVLHEELLRHPLSARALRAYERRRKGPVWATQQVLEGFHLGFMLEFPHAEVVRSTALEVVGKSRLLRRFFIQQADGRIDGPRWMRHPLDVGVWAGDPHE